MAGLAMSPACAQPAAEGDTAVRTQIVEAATEPRVESPPLVAAARARMGVTRTYDGAYTRLDYPGGDVEDWKGVCTDVVVRAYRAAHGFDLQRAVHEDMRAEFGAYPDIWGLQGPDRNIDHRRVPNLETWFARQGAELTGGDFRAGDVVSWRLDGRLPHIGVVSDRRAFDGTPLIIHNIGAGTREEDVLHAFPVHRHFRFVPEDAS